LVIAGEEGGSLRRDDLEGREGAFEEGAGAVGRKRAGEGEGVPQNGGERFRVEAERAGLRRLPGERRCTSPEGMEGGGVIVLMPAGQGGEIAGLDDRRRVGLPHRGPGGSVIRPIRWRSASSWDRAY